MTLEHPFARLAHAHYPAQGGRDQSGASGRLAKVDGVSPKNCKHCQKALLIKNSD
jgi:hypothetical protein